MSEMAMRVASGAPMPLASISSFKVVATLCASGENTEPEAKSARAHTPEICRYRPAWWFRLVMYTLREPEAAVAASRHAATG